MHALVFRPDIHPTATIAVRQLITVLLQTADVSKIASMTALDSLTAHAIQVTPPVVHFVMPSTIANPPMAGVTRFATTTALVIRTVHATLAFLRAVPLAPRSTTASHQMAVVSRFAQ